MRFCLMSWLSNHSCFTSGESGEWESQDQTKKDERNHMSKSPKLKIISLMKTEPHTYPRMVDSHFHTSLKIPHVLIPTENQTLDDGILSEVYHYFSLCLHYGFL